MKKTETVCRAIARAGLDPAEFTIYPSAFGQPVIIEKRAIKYQPVETELPSVASDFGSTLVIHPDDGIKRIAEQIKDKFLGRF